MKQINASICLGMGDVGKRRLKIYQEKIKARGYKSLSAYVVNRLDQELDVEIPTGPRQKSNSVQYAMK
jgi:hypothetical protein